MDSLRARRGGNCAVLRQVGRERRGSPPGQLPSRPAGDRAATTEEPEGISGESRDRTGARVSDREYCLVRATGVVGAGAGVRGAAAGRPWQLPTPPSSTQRRPGRGLPSSRLPTTAVQAPSSALLLRSLLRLARGCGWLGALQDPQRAGEGGGGCRRSIQRIPQVSNAVQTRLAPIRAICGRTAAPSSRRRSPQPPHPTHPRELQLLMSTRQAAFSDPTLLVSGFIGYLVVLILAQSTDATYLIWSQCHNRCFVPATLV